jgi:hypothetical protein
VSADFTCTCGRQDRPRRGMCGNCYERWRRAQPAPLRRSLADRLWSRVEKTDTCWLWTGANWNGYGQIRADNRVRLVHRVSYELLVGPIPEGFQIDHLCRVHNCVNPAHLEAVTPRTNNLRGTSAAAVAARRTHCPQNHPYDNENTHINARGHRRCRACNREQKRQKAAALREAS